MLGFVRAPRPTVDRVSPTVAREPAAFMARLAAPSGRQLASRVIVDEPGFVRLSVPAGDLVANGRVAKFLVDMRRPDDPQVYFINGNFMQAGMTPDAARYHYYFARETLSITEDLDEFNAVTYFSAMKRFAAGVVHTYLLNDNPEPVYGLQFYPQDVVAEQGVLDVLTKVRGAITIPDARFAFVATGTQQTVATVEDRLRTAGFDSLTVDRVIGAVNYLPLNAGEAWGYLRIFPGSDTLLTPADIPVFEQLPLDLSVVAGVITRAVQDSNSHVNLKSKERGTPNMVLRDASRDNPRLAAFADKPVHLTVAKADFTVELSTAEEIAQKLAARGDRPVITLGFTPETRVRSYSEMAADSAAAALGSAQRYGSKAGNLGFLTHRNVLGRNETQGTVSARFGYDLVPTGFGVPLSFYWNLVNLPDNTALRAAVDAFAAAEMAGSLTPAERAARVFDVQTLFLNATIPPTDLTAIKDKIAEVLPGVKKIKIRSSANAEDVPNFDGAGLHDSFAATVAKLDSPDGSCAFEMSDEPGGDVKRKVSPKSIACAVKGVYASLWNQRAVEERTFARIDQSSVAMGLSVVGAYDNESEVVANAVVVTRVINAEGILGYTVSVQAGNNLVTNPDPGTLSEVTIAGLGVGDEPTSLTITRYATPIAGQPMRTQPVLPRAVLLELVEIARSVELAYCAAKPSYYQGDCGFVPLDDEKPTSLDLEFKILANGHFVCKQVREFGGR